MRLKAHRRPGRRLRFGVLAAAVLCAAPAWGGPPVRADAVVEFLAGDDRVLARLIVEIARTPEEQARGLMGRVLSDHLYGMLFLFDRARPLTFWMRDTPTPLDIFFVGEDQRILNIAAHTVPFSERLYPSAGPARYVVEARAGFAERYGIRPGHRIRWNRPR
ncbi:MAG: DUF192 domain-containing protein [Desulfobacterales bacterium]